MEKCFTGNNRAANKSICEKEYAKTLHETKHSIKTQVNDFFLKTKGRVATATKV